MATTTTRYLKTNQSAPPRAAYTDALRSTAAMFRANHNHTAFEHLNGRLHNCREGAAATAVTHPHNTADYSSSSRLSHPLTKKKEHDTYYNRT